MVDFGHLVDEGDHPVVVVEHEGVVGEGVAGSALNLQEGLLLGFWAGKGELPDAVFVPDGWSAIGNHDDLLVDATVFGQELACEHEAVSHVGALLVVETA